MEDVGINTKAISKNNKGFPEWLDFDRLRREGMDYLGELSGNLWTDHNTHDPGITILEMLCYALLDLGYRTSLPAKDLFSRDPKETGDDDNFFTPAQILGCNPLTILDYRKLLVDTKGVKNAWLTIADDITLEKICGLKQQPEEVYMMAANRGRNCQQFLNGLYHVFIDVENYEERNEVVERVKKKLMAHRNLCEDFYDITVLCKQRLGVCADIEIEASADAGTVFLQIVERLRDFISPFPKFYSLKQLLEEKKRPIEEIFAGRPYDLTESYGFVDVEEFESIVLRKEIHLSDVYDVIFAVNGVKAIRNLRLQNCDGSRCLDERNARWIFKIFENHVPEFTLECSGFHFTRSGVAVSVDQKKFKEYLDLTFSNSGKLALRPGSDLDSALPVGAYHEDLATYFPLENDFPKVYGIAEGSLPSKVSAYRKAQSLQLRAYLLFFDHLLSGYLSQLKNLRHLFSFRPSEQAEHTYFINHFNDWPGLDKLVRFSLTEDSSASFGNVQASLVAKKQLETITATGKIIDCDFQHQLPPYSFCSAAERDIAISQLIQDAANGNMISRVIETRNHCWFFYLYSSSDQFAIVGPDEYATEDAARRAGEAILFLAASQANYRSYITDDKKRFSFHLTTGVAGYWSYLQSLTENKAAYLQRRNLFLDHLLARFSETFTDYALLSYSFFQEEQLEQNKNRLKENFLGHYPELSSNRGKAYDYSTNGWNNANVSGFEKKSLAYAGIEKAMQENLCHFEVAEFEAQSVVNLAWKGIELFKSENSFDSRIEAKAALQELMTALQDQRNYAVPFSSLENNHTIEIRTGDSVFRSAKSFSTYNEAQQAITQYSRLFSPLPLPADVQPSLFSHQVLIEKKSNAASWQKKDALINEEPVLRLQSNVLDDFPGEKWQPIAGVEMPDNISLRSNPDQPNELVNLKAFDYYVNRVDVRNGLLVYQFTVSDLQKKFFFVSEQEFSNADAADQALIRFLFLLANPDNYSKQQLSSGEWYNKIIQEGQAIATNKIEYRSTAELNEAAAFIVEYVNDQLYGATINTTPIRWKYNLLLGLPGTTQLSFTSNTEYDSYERASGEAAKIYQPSSKLRIALDKKNVLQIKDPKRNSNVIASHTLPDDASDTGTIEEEASDLLALKRMIKNASDNPAAPQLDEMIIPDGISRQGNFGYRLVQKDKYYASYYWPRMFQGQAHLAQEIKALHKTFTSGLHFLEIYYGGENTRELKDGSTGTSHYRFLIKSRLHPYADGDELTLFESNEDYSSAEEAQAAFEKQYISILTAASDPKNYGTFIGFDENAGKNIRAIAATPRVFIPAETMSLFGYNQQHAADSLSAIAQTYPVQAIKKTDPVFADYFLCKEDQVPQATEPCGCPKEEKDVYFFKLRYHPNDGGSWISSRYFDTPKEALREFYFFLVLLQYKGNYHVAWNECDCTPHLYLREILAESGRRFPTAAQAWGREGVEKFICTAQSENAFFTYRNEKNCCFTFKVACANTGLVHPCTYDTPEQRDQAMEKLLRASNTLADEFETGNLIRQWQNVIGEWQDRFQEKRRPAAYCEDAIEAMKEITKYLWEQDRSLNFYTASENEIDPEQLARFKNLATYFPVKRKRLHIPNTDVYKYFLEIRLPGFCEEDLKEAIPCGCSSSTDDGCRCCCIAWTSECCFDSCEEAMDYYRKVVACLADASNYYPAFDCECGPYGIRFSCNCDEHQRNPENPGQNEKEEHNCCNDIVAYNPQCYTTAKMVCDAVQRAKHLVNAEGLHLVEHILLRPHCIDGDCNCLLPTCNETSLCEFDWKLPADDPCTKDQSYCFLPGADPYSFIATVVLPAWPERFRKIENRQLMEQLLYREAPAHIMLRVLWLNPFDLCRFEFLYHNWCKWLAGKPVCGDHNAPCELIEFLFRHTAPDMRGSDPFECFECTECVPCSPSANPIDPCAGVTETSKDPNEYVNTINELYCWPLICPQPKPTYDFQIEKAATSAPVEPLLSGPEVVTTPEENIEAERKMDERFYRYRTSLKELAERTGNTNAGIAWQFVTIPSSSFDDFERTINAIVANKKMSEEEKKLTTEEKKSLIEQLSWYYLDHAVWAGTLETHKAEMIALFEKLKKKNLLPDYKRWKGSELLAVKHDAPLKFIKKLFS